MEETFEVVQYDFLKSLLDFLFQWETKQNSFHMNVIIKWKIPLIILYL